MGNISQEQQYKVVNAANKIIVPKFELSLNKTGYFKRAQIAWLGADSAPEPLLTLNQQLLNVVKQSNIAISQKPYQPHITLARKSEKINKVMIKPVGWTVTSFVLFKSIDSRDGVEYKIVQSFGDES